MTYALPVRHIAPGRPRRPAGDTASSVLRGGYLATSLFLITLQSFYFANGGGGLSLLCYLGLLMLLPFIAVEPVRYVLLPLPLILIGFASIKALLAADGQMSLLGMAFSALAVLAVPAASGWRSLTLARALSMVILIHVGLVAVQVLYFAATLSHLDLLGGFGFEPQRVFSSKGLLVFGLTVPRFAGLFNEPGTYSAVMMTLVVARYAVLPRIDRTLALALASVVATMSMGGLVLATAFMGIVLITSAARRGRVIEAVAGLIALPIAVAWLRRLYAQRSLIDEGEIYQVYLWNWFWAQPRTAFGSSVEQLQRGIVINDIGVWVYAIHVTGVIATTLLAITLLATLSLTGLGLLTVILMSKVKMTYPLLYLGLAALLMGQSASHAPPGAIPLPWLR